MAITLKSIKTNTMFINKITVKTVALSICAFLFFTACSSEKQVNDNAEVQSLPITQPMYIDTMLSDIFVADIQSPQHVEIRARVRGFMEKIHVDEGQEVKQGQLLFSLSGQEYREELNRSEAAYKSAAAEAKIAEVEHKNTQILLDKEIVSQAEVELAAARLEAARAKVDEAGAAVSAARLALSFTEIKAPFAGIINRQPNKVGSLIEEGMLLTTISANHDVYAYFNVAENTYLDLMQRPDGGWKKNLSLLLANGQKHPFSGQVETAETVVDKKTGNIAFRARFPNPGHLLKHGASGKVVIHHSLKNALVIPQKSTFDAQDKTYVFVINGENAIQRRPIKTKARLGHLYVIESGLTTEDRVLYEGIQRVKEGEKVNPEMMLLGDIMTTLAMR